MKHYLENDQSCQRANPDDLPFPIPLRMFLMRIPAFHVNLRQTFIPDNQQILRILFLSGFRKIETSSDHRFPVNDHELVVGDGVSVIYKGGNACIGQEGG